jgi:hypothetical protein
MFAKNFAAYAEGTPEAVREAGPVVDPNTRSPELESDHGAG